MELLYAVSSLHGATMVRAMGMAPSPLVVLPTNQVTTDEVPDANVMHNVPS
jgi:hypothetical protein